MAAAPLRKLTRGRLARPLTRSAARLGSSLRPVGGGPLGLPRDTPASPGRFSWTPLPPFTSSCLPPGIRRIWGTLRRPRLPVSSLLFLAPSL